MIIRNMVHELQFHTVLFGELWHGQSKPLLLKAIRPYNKRDGLILREYDPYTEEYSGRTITMEISNVTYGNNPNHVSVTGIETMRHKSLADPYREVHAKCRALTMTNPEIYMQAVKFACPYCGNEIEHSAIGMSRGEWISLIDGMKSANGIRRFCTRIESGCRGQIKTFVVRLSETPEYYERA